MGRRAGRWRNAGAGAVAVATLVVGACGGSDGSSNGPPPDGGGALTVSAASSLKAAFTAYAATLPRPVRFQFAGSDALAAQIEQGVTPDVFAAANTKLPEQLFAEGRVEKPVRFAGNRLVIAVPRSADGVRSIADLARAGTTVAVGAAGVPIGDYTAKVLGRLPAAQREAIQRNVRSEEPDVAGIVGKLTQGAVDAGFVYVTDVVAAKGALRAIALPADLQPTVAYAAAVVKRAPDPQAARAFVAGLRSPAAQRALRRAGFLPPPGA